MDQNEMSILYREPSIDAYYQVSYHLAKRFQRKGCFRNRPIRNKNCLWWPCLLTDQNGMCNSYRGPSIDAPTTFRSIWPSCFRVEDFQKSTNQKQEFPVVAMFVNGLGQNEQSLQRTFHRCFLTSFGSFGNAVSEDKIFRNRPIRNKNCLLQPCLLMDRDEMSILYRGLSIDASYQISVHLAKRFQSIRFLDNNQSETRIVCGGHAC